MSANSKIEWTEATWNPIRARRRRDGKMGWYCQRVSAGCANCYADRMNVKQGNNPGRLGTGIAYAADKLDQVELFLDEDVLVAPLRWRRGRQVFVCSMTDWFADFVPDSWIAAMLGVMAMAPQHTFQALTKRAARQQRFFAALGEDPKVAQDRLMEMARSDGGYDLYFDDEADCRIANAMFGNLGDDLNVGWPMRHLQLCVSAEDQPTADERIPLLLQTPAAVRGVSLEPLLGPIDLGHINDGRPGDSDPGYSALEVRPDDTVYNGFTSTLDWVIVGGESGPGARPMHPEWVRDLRDQCVAAKVPFFFKQWGAWMPTDKPEGFIAKARRAVNWHEFPDGTWMENVGKKAAGRLLDGREWNEYPRCSARRRGSDGL